MNRKYIVTARDGWDSDMVSLFGERGSLHELSDSAVVNAIIKCGRAEITLSYKDVDGTLFQLEFQTGYD